MKRLILLLLLAPSLLFAQQHGCDTIKDLPAKAICLKSYLQQLDSTIDSSYLALDKRMELLITNHAGDPFEQDMYISAKLRFAELRKNWEKYRRTECDLCFGLLEDNMDGRICNIRCKILLAEQKLELLSNWRKQISE